MGDNYLENINVMVSWGFSRALVTAIYIVSQNSRTYFCHFYDYETYSQFIMNRRLQDSGAQLVQA